jgi:hypothetical protein
MTERIKELVTATDAWCDQNFPPDWTERVDEFLPLWNEKFAELIVRECANHCDLLLDHKISSEWSRGTHDCSRAIKKHFGVEE